MKLYEQTAVELQERLAAREIKATELVAAVFQQIGRVEPRVKAYLTLTEEQAMSRATAVDEARASGGTPGPLAGIPLAVKDNMCTRDVPTTCASRILAGFRPPYDATVVARLAAAGTPFTGKSNMDEFAMGSSTENSSVQATANPWKLDTVPGGSSGGSAAAVACGEAIWALGSDTGGSVRLPASFCGVVGMKPTYGRVSRYGLVAFASSLDQIGPLTRTVRDNARLLGAIAGPDPLDGTSLPDPVPDYEAGLEQGIKGLRIGLPAEMFAAGMAPAVRQAVDAAVKQLEGLGAELREVSLPTSNQALPCYYIICTAEASANLARYDGIRYGHRGPAENLETLYTRTRAEGFGPEVKRRIMLGTYALSSGYYDAYYKQAQQVRTLIIRDFQAVFEHCDLLVAATSPTTAFRLGEKTDDPLSMYLSDVLTVTINLAGLPAISVPCGFDADGLPIGLQLIGPPLSEATLYRAAYAYEQAAGHFRRRPELV